MNDKLEGLIRTLLSYNDTCTWTEDFDGNFETTCNNMFVFNDGGPEENSFIYCPYCSKKINSVLIPRNKYG